MKPKRHKTNPKQVETNLARREKCDVISKVLETITRAYQTSSTTLQSSLMPLVPTPSTISSSSMLALPLTTAEI